MVYIVFLLDLLDVVQSAQNKKSFVKEELVPLIEHDILSNTELLRALQVLYEQNENLRQSAKALFNHHTTMRYRLDQIESLTGAVLNLPETNLELQIALKLAAIL